MRRKMRSWKPVVLGWLVLVLCLLGVTASASYGEAVVDGRNATKVHLRAEATSKSESLGLYYDGTVVECLSDPSNEWVEVEIGLHRGYMYGPCLKRGKAAQNVVSAQPTGYTTAKNYARLRRGPSTEYQMLREVHPNDLLTILGETSEHWYYVKVGHDDGYISAGLVRLDGEVAVNTYVSNTSSGINTSNINNSASVGWARAYMEYLYAHEDSDRQNTYDLIDVNDDLIPELVIYTGVEASGCKILTYYREVVDVLQTSRLYFTYLPRENMLCNSEGHMGYYYDDVYTIQDGKWVQIASGSYEGITDRWDSEYERYVCQSYFWNNRAVTREEYMRSLLNIYDLNRGQESHHYLNFDGIINRLRTVRE